tara:strand:+ start:317 stop:598 length:282 start_codon:yes stop_codon:yes gene_type:complete
MNNDTLGHMALFLENKSLFRASAVSREWNHAMIFTKCARIQEIAQFTRMCHICNNACPCYFDGYVQTLFSDYKLKQLVCANMKGEQNWISKYR